MSADQPLCQHHRKLQSEACAMGGHQSSECQYQTYRVRETCSGNNGFNELDYFYGLGDGTATTSETIVVAVVVAGIAYYAYTKYKSGGF